MRHHNTFFGLAFAAVCMVGLTACKEDPHNLNSEEMMRATTGGESYATKAGDTFLGCSGTDSPPVDDYTSCTVKPKGGGATYGIQCSYKSVGCKPK